MANSYNHVLTVEEVKHYLRLDDAFDDDDMDIERMIASAFGYIEKQTQHIFKPQDKTYHKDYSGYINIYEHPITTSTFPDNEVPLYYPGFIRFCGIDSVTLNIGYNSKDNVPSELIDCALQMIKVWYYEAEKNVNTTLLPENVKQIIDTNRRFIAC